MKIGIAGAGLAGRLLALECSQRGWDVTLFDQDNSVGQKSCGWVAAGMLAPYTEFESSEPLLLQLGLDALTIWPTILQQLTLPVSFHRTGTLIVAHPQDIPDLRRFKNTLDHKLKSIENKPNIVKVTRENSQLEQLVPGLSPIIQEGYWLQEEGHIDSVQFFTASAATLRARGVQWHENIEVNSVQPNQIKTSQNTYDFDLACDCRGLGAKPAWPQLRGIRGELLWLRAPDVKLHCPVRLLHPRHPIYISPRNDHLYVVGATSIESEDTSPISVESMMELLSTAYTIHPGFAEARIVNTLTQSRPTFADHQPKITHRNGLLKINGLYRHGYMVGPAVIQDAMRLLETGKHSLKHIELIEEEETTLCK